LLFTTYGRLVGCLNIALSGLGLIRLKASLKLYRMLNIPPKGVCKAFIKGYETYVTYNTSGGFRFNIPKAFQPLFSNEIDNGREIEFILYILDGELHIVYEPNTYSEFEDNYVLSSRLPLYKRGYKYCSRCGEAYLTRSKHCPICGRKLRTKGRNSKKGEYVKRMEIEGV